MKPLKTTLFVIAITGSILAIWKSLIDTPHHPWTLERFVRKEREYGTFHGIQGTIVHLPGFLERLSEFAFFKASMTVHENISGRESLSAANDREHLGDLFRRQGDILSANACYDKCYKIRSRWLQPNDPLVTRAELMDKISQDELSGVTSTATDSLNH